MSTKHEYILERKSIYIYNISVQIKRTGNKE